MGVDGLSAEILNEVRRYRPGMNNSRRLLHVLFVWFCAVSAHPGRRDTNMPPSLTEGSGSRCARFGGERAPRYLVAAPNRAFLDPQQTALDHATRGRSGFRGTTSHQIRTAEQHSKRSRCLQPSYLSRIFSNNQDIVVIGRVSPQKFSSAIRSSHRYSK